MKKKLLSRKFWTSLITQLAGVVVLLGANENTVQTVAGAAIALASTVIYVLTEGRIDAAQSGGGDVNGSGGA